MSVVNNRVALTNLVSMETLTNEEVLGLINRGSEYKAGKVALPKLQDQFVANLFLKILLELISHLKWPRKTWVNRS